MSAQEPTIADVLEAIREVRVTMLEMRADQADRQSRTSERLDDISRRLGTLTDEIADFRREYSSHHHPGEEAA
ncbi:MAG TPA: hypothetical protein VGA04_33775 [Streptosporangiaceae bacterium]